MPSLLKLLLSRRDEKQTQKQPDASCKSSLRAGKWLACLCRGPLPTTKQVGWRISTQGYPPDYFRVARPLEDETSSQATVSIVAVKVSAMTRSTSENLSDYQSCEELDHLFQGLPELSGDQQFMERCSAAAALQQQAPTTSCSPAPGSGITQGAKHDSIWERRGHVAVTLTAPTPVERPSLHAALSCPSLPAPACLPQPPTPPQREWPRLKRSLTPSPADEDVLLARLDCLVATAQESSAAGSPGSSVPSLQAIACLTYLLHRHLPGASSTAGVPLTYQSMGREMGFQGADPSSDIRGSGLMGLQHLVYLSQHHPHTFSALMHKTQTNAQGRRAAFEYPFATACLVVSQELKNRLGLSTGCIKKRSSVPDLFAGQQARLHAAFRLWLAQDCNALGELFVASMWRLDQQWLACGAEYMEFPAVLRLAMGDVATALLQGPVTSGGVLTARLAALPLAPALPPPPRLTRSPTRSSRGGMTMGPVPTAIASPVTSSPTMIKARRSLQSLSRLLDQAVLSRI